MIRLLEERGDNPAQPAKYAKRCERIADHPKKIGDDSEKVDDHFLYSLLKFKINNILTYFIFGVKHFVKILCTNFRGALYPI